MRGFKIFADIIKDRTDIFVEDSEKLKEYLDMVSLGSCENGEKHHILPRSLFPEYELCKWNIVNLSYEDHYLAHELLPQITIGVSKLKMSKAWNIMCGITKGAFITKDSYAELRKLFVDSMTGENNPFYGITGEDHPSFGSKHSDETKLKMRESHKDETEETRLKKSLSHLGKTHLEATKLKISEGRKGKKHSDELKIRLSLEKGISVTINGVSYRSVKHASNETGISRTTISRLMDNFGNVLEYVLPDTTIELNGVVYNSIRQASICTGMCRKTISKILKRKNCADL